MMPECPFNTTLTICACIVARIAYQFSDVVLSVQPSLASESEFSSTLRDLVEAKTQSKVAKGLAEVRLSSLDIINTILILQAGN